MGQRAGQEAYQTGGGRCWRACETRVCAGWVSDGRGWIAIWIEGVQVWKGGAMMVALLPWPRIPRPHESEHGLAVIDGPLPWRCFRQQAWALVDFGQQPACARAAAATGARDESEKNRARQSAAMLRPLRRICL